jgi:hypothetical protein
VTINISSIAPSGSSFTGTLSWKGDDAGFIPVYDADYNIISVTPQVVHVDETKPLDAANTKCAFSRLPDGTPIFSFNIINLDGSDSYGPDLSCTFGSRNGVLVLKRNPYGSDVFEAHPLWPIKEYRPGVSVGALNLGPSGPLGIDFSYGTTSLDGWKSIHAAGVQIAVADLWNGFHAFTNAASQLDLAAQAGLDTAGYVALSFSKATRTGAAQVDAAVDGSLGGSLSRAATQLKFLAIDVEPIRNAPVKVNAAQWIRDAVTETEKLGLQPIIYTSRGGWKSITHGSTAFSTVPLWDAQYDGKSGLAPFATYGGWSHRIGKQYQQNKSIGNLVLDPDVFDSSWL